MATKFENINNYNEAIASESNNIGQKLFAYIAKGKNINDRIREKFKKSLIFIGDEGQIYNPLTNTYIGIGQTAYISTINYIEDAHEKIKELNQMLASSMVSAIYANWSQNEWSYNSVKTTLEETKYNDTIPSKIYATNEIILKGHGDYDPSTKLAATREYSHITDENLPDSDLYKHTYKTLNQTVKYKYTNTSNDVIDFKDREDNTVTVLTIPANSSVTLDYQLNYDNFNLTNDEKQHLKETLKEILIPIGNAFATSGITVSLNKGLNRYLFSYTFTRKPDGIDGIDESRIKISDCMKYVGQAPSTEEFSKTLNIYLTFQDYKTYIENIIAGSRKNIYDNDNNKILDSADSIDLHRSFFAGLEGVYEDGKELVGSNSSDLNDKKIYTYNNLKNQLFKQAPNTLTIDDKLTWSYIASAYTYTLGFAKEYTDNQVNKIYRELLGEQSALIPATKEQVLVMIPNENATLNKDKYNWDETSGTWSYAPDNIYESSSNLSSFILDYSSTFVVRHTLAATAYQPDGKPLNALNPTTANIEEGQQNVPVYPWNALEELASHIANVKTTALKNWETYTYNVPGASITTQYAYVINALDESLKGFKYTKWIPENKDTHTPAGFEDEASGVLKYNSNPITTFDGLKNICFMGYDKTVESNNETIIITTIESGGTKYLDDDYSNISGLSVKWDTTYNKYATHNTTDKSITITTTTKYKGKNYSLSYIYRPVVNAKINFDSGGNFSSLTVNDFDKALNETTNPLFVVNTSYISMDNINLADGIQTLKEVAYVLDMITDGWGNRYADAEGNGILLTYTIAQNHERIVDHEKRLLELEGGKNVVKNIYKETSAMSRYVNLHISSDTSWISSFNSTNTPSNFKTSIEDIINLNKSYTWYGAFDTGTIDDINKNIIYKYESLPQSYIYAYSLILNEYVNHSSTHSISSMRSIEPPTFSGLFGNKYSKLSYFVEFSYTDGSNNTIEINEEEVAAYTGKIGLGIDINVATTYTSYQYCENNLDGYEVVDLNSSFVKKTGVCYLTVSNDISYNSYIAKFTEPNPNNYRYENPYVNESNLRFSDNDIFTLNGATYSEDGTGLLANYKTEIDNYLSNFNLDGCTLVVDGKDREYTGIDMKLWLNITGIDKEGYRNDIYNSEYISETNNYVTYKYTNETEANIDFSESTLTPGSSIESETRLETIEGIKEEIINHNTTLEICVDDLGKQTYYIRKKAVVNKIADLSSDGLTNVDWVTTYVSQVVDNVTRSIKGIEFEAYQYSRNLISQLDTSFASSYGMYLAGIEQKDGKVSPIIRELPKDNITASTTFWGENTENSKNYTAVASEDIEKEIAMDTPLFIQSGVEYYEVPVLSSGKYYVHSKNYNNTVGDMLYITTTNNIDDTNGQYVYYIDDTGEIGEMTMVGKGLTYECISSINVGPKYRNFIQFYFARPAYQRIDGADLRIVETEWRLLLGYTPGANEGDPAVPNYKVFSYEGDPAVPNYAAQIYKLADSNQPQEVKQYISAQVDYQSAYTDGVGGNNFKVTAHITKLSDASENNSGLVDAYDVRNTLDNMFEWVDLSRWDEDASSTQINPINTEYDEKGGNLDASTRISYTKATNASEKKSNSLGYPIDPSIKELNSSSTPVEENSEKSE